MTLEYKEHRRGRKKRYEIIALFDEDWTSSIYYFSLKIVKARKKKGKEKKNKKN